LFGLAEQACRSAIVNDEAAAELFNGYTAGRTVRDPSNLSVELIGVVAMRKPAAAPGNRPTIYYNYSNQQGPTPVRIPRARFRAPIRSALATAEITVNIVSPGYFEAMGLTLIAGSGFASHPRTSECRIGIVNQEAADLYFGRNAVGSAVIDDRGRRTGIVGVSIPRPSERFSDRRSPGFISRCRKTLSPI
jgi:hypothetical protein